MIISSKMKKDYPKLSAWIVENIPKVMNKPVVFKAFCKYSEQGPFSAVISLSVIGFPLVDHRAMSDAYGEFSGSSAPNTIYISTALCDKFEKSPTDAKDARMHRLLEATILHETVHWGDWKDGVDQPDEEGLAFEKAAYGAVINQYW